MAACAWRIRATCLWVAQPPGPLRMEGFLMSKPEYPSADQIHRLEGILLDNMRAQAAQLGELPLVFIRSHPWLKIRISNRG